MRFWDSLFPAAVLAGTPLLLGALGEILTERAGNLNLGVEGMMFMGAISGLAGSYFYEQAVLILRRDSQRRDLCGDRPDHIHAGR